MWVVIEKKKGLRGLKIPKRRLSLVFAVGRKGKAKKMFVFLHPALFFITPVYNDPTENEKKKFTPFFKLVFPF
jgi:CRISPR/Cas system CSM-associated protein Csm2 small subunit